MSTTAPLSKLSDLELEIAAFHQPAIDSARKMVFWAGFIYPLYPVVIFAALARLVGTSIFATTAFAVAFGIGCAICAAHVGLAWWCKRQPLPATSIALGVFVAYLVLVNHYVGTPNLLVAGVGLFVLGRGVLAAYRAHKLRRAAATARA